MHEMSVKSLRNRYESLLFLKGLKAVELGSFIGEEQTNRQHERITVKGIGKAANEFQCT